MTRSGRFCQECGHEVAVAARFCVDCGCRLDPSPEVASDTHAGEVRLTAHDRRVHPGALAGARPAVAGAPTWLAEVPDQVVWVCADSPELERAGRPFNPLNPPRPEDWVPGDCVWAFFKHPGPHRAVQTGYLEIRFRKMKVLIGRTRTEVALVAGSPKSSTDVAGGGHVDVWNRRGFLSSYAIALGFDQYGVCSGIVEEKRV